MQMERDTDTEHRGYRGRYRDLEVETDLQRKEGDTEDNNSCQYM